jgi:hypothetical protein
VGLTPVDPYLLLVPLLLLHAVLGAFDTLVNHEWRARLPARPGAAPELSLHALRSLLYAVLFAMLAAAQWHGRWAVLPLAVSLAEVVVTSRDTVVEFRLRHIDALERVVHLALLLNTGAYTLLLGLAVADEDVLRAAPFDAWHAALGLAALGAAASGLRDGFAAAGRARADAPGAATPGRAAAVTPGAR